MFSSRSVKRFKFNHPPVDVDHPFADRTINLLSTHPFRIIPWSIAPWTPLNDQFLFSIGPLGDPSELEVGTSDGTKLAFPRISRLFHDILLKIFGIVPKVGEEKARFSAGHRRPPRLGQPPCRDRLLR